MKNGIFSAAILVADNMCSQRQSWRRSLPRRMTTIVSLCKDPDSIQLTSVLSSLANIYESWVDPKNFFKGRDRGKAASLMKRDSGRCPMHLQSTSCA
jgi:hypothetical protein